MIAPDQTTRLYIDAEKREKIRRKARRENAEALRLAEEDERRIAAEQSQKEREHGDLIELQKVEVRTAKLALVAARRRLAKELRTLDEFRVAKIRDLTPVRTKLLIARSRLRTETGKFKKLNPTKQPGQKRPASVYPNDARSWPGPQTNLVALSQKTGVNPTPVQGGLADGRGRGKRRLARINLARKSRI